METCDGTTNSTKNIFELSDFFWSEDLAFGALETCEDPFEEQFEFLGV